VARDDHGSRGLDEDQGVVPLVAVVAEGAVVALATVQLVLARARALRAVVVGVQQLVFGFAVMIAAGLALATT
jgi:hypothetical protein